ncbi:MAG: hypothetical protein U5J97_11290 [Trueperaceae bacterium]|nr:hypothetical protein [Trueperaceae bacterium]
MGSDDRPRHRRFAPAVVACVVVVVALAFLAGCGGQQETAAAPGTSAAGSSAAAPSAAAPAATPADDARLVRTVTPEVGTLRANRSASARIRALREASVASGASARVTEILARPGDEVAEGQLVIRLDDDAAALRADSARLAVRQAEIDLERARRASEEGASQARDSLSAAQSNVRTVRDRVAEVRALVAAGGAARADLNALETQLEQAQASLGQAQDAVARAERSEGEDLALLELQLQQSRVQARQAQDALSETEIRAPFAGQVVELFLETGEFAGAGQPAFRMHSLVGREAVFDVPPEDAARLLEQGEVSLRYAGRDVLGTLVASARPSQQARLVQLTARIDGEDSRIIPTGALAEVRYDIALADGALIPSGAIASESGATWVYLVQDGVATRTPVDVLAEAGAMAAVAGIDETAAVIHPRPLDVRIGTRVRTEP